MLMVIFLIKIFYMHSGVLSTLDAIKIYIIYKNMKNFANAAAKRINNIHMNLGYIVFECLCVFYSNRIFLRLDVNFFFYNIFYSIFARAIQYFLHYFFTLFFIYVMIKITDNKYTYNCVLIFFVLITTITVKKK